MDVAANSLLPRLVPAAMLGRVFGNLYGAIGVAAALSYVAGSVLLDLTSAPVTLVVAGGLGLVVTIAPPSGCGAGPDKRPCRTRPVRATLFVRAGTSTTSSRRSGPRTW